MYTIRVTIHVSIHVSFETLKILYTICVYIHVEYTTHKRIYMYTYICILTYMYIAYLLVDHYPFPTTNPQTPFLPPFPDRLPIPFPTLLPIPIPTPQPTRLSTPLHTNHSPLLCIKCIRINSIRMH